MTDSDNERRNANAQDRFEAVRGKADIKWHTEDLMDVLRGDDTDCLIGRACPEIELDPGATFISD
ncbi:hypothetical protein [Pseudomonas sp. GM48]|uniref:hypothetical protein n=1 Tax=Pseudomonas sp. GM48 TaxID=1144330 RepID=UPI0002701826|nr:hypothetical protein [Pseudomonas sp. GM48]EJM58346.1 hypothetical protein PMI28_02249 [Pseudomonas sp. GM48]